MNCLICWISVFHDTMMTRNKLQDAIRVKLQITYLRNSQSLNSSTNVEITYIDGEFTVLQNYTYTDSFPLCGNMEEQMIASDQLQCALLCDYSTKEQTLP